MKSHLRITIATLLGRDASHHEISRRTGVDRKTIRRYAKQLAAVSPVATGAAEPTGANSSMATGSAEPAEQIPPLRPPAPAAGPTKAVRSACEPHRAWIEEQAGLGRNAVAIYQELVEEHGFTHRYNSVKRFVRALKRREPERFDVLESSPAEEAQVDFGQGALTLAANGKYRRPWLFVMTLKYSGKSFRKVVWKANQETWARLHEEAFRTFGGAVEYVVLDNLKQGVIRPDLYEPELNVLYAELLSHYGVVADPARVGDPDRKGTVENAIQHTQGTALKGKKFESIEAQNEWLAHWEERWAAPRIHGRKKRQVLAMFAEERPYLKQLPAQRFRYFKQDTRTVDDAGLVQVDAAYYAALPAQPHTEVVVRIYEHEIEILGDVGEVLRRHKTVARGKMELPEADRLFNPSRETARLLAKVHKIGSQSSALAHDIFARRGRPGQRAIYGLANLTRHYAREEIEAACATVLTFATPSYQAVKRLLERRAAAAAVVGENTALIQSGDAIRALDEYQAFFESYSQSTTPCPSTTNP